MCHRNVICCSLSNLKKSLKVSFCYRFMLYYSLNKKITMQRVLCGRLLLLHVPIDVRAVHNTAPLFAAAKKTTSAAGGVMGLGKGKKKLGKLGTMEKRELPVETDPNKLVTHVCGANIYTTGEDPKLGPDSEYPDWLWELRTGPAPPLEELDPNTKAYWLRVRAAGMRRNNKLRSLRKF